MKNTILLFAFCMLCCSASVIAQNTTPTAAHKVVIQLNSADTAAWGGVIGNIKNLSKIWPDQLQIEVVVHGLNSNKVLEILKQPSFLVYPQLLLCMQRASIWYQRYQRSSEHLMV